MRAGAHVVVSFLLSAVSTLLEKDVRKEKESAWFITMPIFM